jgi:hypothetical protein
MSSIDINESRALLEALKKYVSLETIACEMDKGYMTIYRWYLGKGKPCKAEFEKLEGMLDYVKKNNGK